MTDNNTIDLRRLFRTIKRLKPVYLYSVIFFSLIAITYCLLKQPQYEIKATLMIEDNNDDRPAIGGTMGMMMRTFSAGGFGGTSVDNELQIINSHRVLLATAKDLKLNITYLERDGLRKRMLYPDTPILVTGNDDLFDTLSVSLTMKIKLTGDRADIKVTKGFVPKTLCEQTDCSLPVEIETPFGIFTVARTDNPPDNAEIDVKISGYNSVAEFLYNDIRVDKADKISDAVSFELLYPNKERGIAILNALMNAYNNRRIERKHFTAREEADFLDRRISAIFDQLSEAEGKIKDLKTRNNTLNMAAEAPLLVEQTLEARSELVKAQAESLYLEDLMSALTSTSATDELLPVFDQEAYPMVKDYNSLVMEKRRMLQSASENNPAVKAIAENLKDLRRSVIKNVENLLKASRSNERAQQSLAGVAESKLSSLPETERDYIVLERERSLKNALYLYLADKRESALLQLASSAAPGFIVDEAYSSIKPSRKKALIVCGVCALLALIIPTLFAIVKTWKDRKVRDKIDLSGCGLENECFISSNSEELIKELRSEVLSHANVGMLYLFGHESLKTAEMLGESLVRTGRSIELISIDDANTEMILKEEFRKQSYDNENRIFLVAQSSIQGIREIHPVIKGDDIIILILSAGETDIDEVKELTSKLKNLFIKVIIRNE